MSKTNQNKTINSDTQINFTVKSFLGTITSILGIFFAFYTLVIIPRIETTEQHYKEMFQDQKEQNRIFYEEINKINNSIGALNSSITTLNQRFRDLNQNLQSHTNSGGSFGNISPDDTTSESENVRELTDAN